MREEEVGMEGIFMANVKREGSNAVICGNNAKEVFEHIKNTPPIDFDREIRKAKKYRVTYSEKGLARIFKRMLRKG